MHRFDISEFTIYLGTILTFSGWLISSISIDIVKDIVTIVVGLATIVYTVYKTLGEISKRKFYKRIEKEQKRDEKKSL